MKDLPEKDVLKKAMHRLTPDQREVIRLRHVQRLSVSAVAEKMDRSESAVRSLSVRALIRLREVLDEKELEAG